MKKITVVSSNLILTAEKMCAYDAADFFAFMKSLSVNMRRVEDGEISLEECENKTRALAERNLKGQSLEVLLNDFFTEFRLLN